MEYPSGWQVEEEGSLAGPLFRSSDLSMQDIQSERIDKDKDCFLTMALLSVSRDGEIPCKDKVGEITLGGNKFVQCQLNSIDNGTSVTYMTLHPKTNNIISFDHVNNFSCQSILEDSLETLTFK